MSQGATLLVTERLHPSPRLLMALGVARSAAPAPAVAASLTPGRDAGLWALRAAGVRHLPLGGRGAPTPEAALLGACTLSGAARILMWDCPRAAMALHALRELPVRPRVEAHLPAEGTSHWDETALVAVRTGNLVDRFLVEDDTTGTRLREIGVAPGRIAHVDLGGEDAAPAGSGAVVVVHGASWEAARGRARGVAEGLRVLGVSSAVARFEAPLAFALGRGPAPGTVVFVEGGLASAAPVGGLLQAGWRVALAPGPVAAAVSGRTGVLVLDDDERGWASAVRDWTAA